MNSVLPSHAFGRSVLSLQNTLLLLLLAKGYAQGNTLTFILGFQLSFKHSAADQS